MRIIKLSDKLLGFESMEKCKTYFLNILSWKNGVFGIDGEGGHFAKSSFRKNETLVFCYSGKIVAIAKVNDITLKQGSDKVESLNINVDSLKVFDNSPDVGDLEALLKDWGYTKEIRGSQGWNVIEGEHEKIAINFLIDSEWKEFKLPMITLTRSSLYDEAAKLIKKNIKKINSSYDIVGQLDINPSEWNVIPSSKIDNCREKLVVFCFGEERLENRLYEAVDHVCSCNHKEVIFITDKWNSIEAANAINSINKCLAPKGSFTVYFWTGKALVKCNFSDQN